MDLETLFAAVLGLVLGSFLNVVIYRLPRSLSVASPARSFCPKCNRTLSWWENIPVLSWVLLLGKCRTCKAPISGQYPAVELLSAVFAVICFERFGYTPTGAVIFALSLTLLVISFIDFEFKLIPNVISYPGITFGLLLGIVAQYTTLFHCPPHTIYWPITQSALDSLVGMLAGGGFFWLIGEGYYLVTKQEGIGGGDVKLMAMTGAILGWQSVAPTIFAGSVSGAIIGILVMVVTGKGRKTEIPFGPWLSLGAILYMFADLPYFRM